MVKKIGFNGRDCSEESSRYRESGKSMGERGKREEE